jgi:hypothetical protein
MEPHTIHHNKTSTLLLTVGVTFEQKHPNQEYDDNADNSGELAGAHLAGLPRPASARRPASVIRTRPTLRPLPAGPSAGVARC